MYKKPWLAALFNTVFTGIGYLYLGQRKVLGWLLVALGISYTLWYFINYETHKAMFDSWQYIVISLAATIPFAFDAYRLAKKNNNKLPASVRRKNEKNLRENRAFRYSFVALIMIFVLLDIAIGFMVFQHAMGWLTYAANGEAVTKNLTAYNSSSNAMLVTLGLSILLIPLLLYIINNKKIHLAFPSTFLILLITGLIVLSDFDNKNMNKAADSKNNAVVTTSGDTYTDKQLFEAINRERKAHNTSELIHEPSTCAVAKEQVTDIAEKGTAIFASGAAFARAIDRAFENNKTLDRETAPDFYTSYLTYQETPADVVEEFKGTESEKLFTDREYKYGCVAMKSGYSIIVVGQNEPESNNKVEEQDELKRIMDTQGSATLL